MGYGGDIVVSRKFCCADLEISFCLRQIKLCKRGVSCHWWSGESGKSITCWDSSLYLFGIVCLGGTVLGDIRMEAAYVGQRRSYAGDLCTVRYVGTVEGTSGEWLGVEWDDPTRGKHSGEHRGVRYFTCKCPLSGLGPCVWD